MEVGTDRLERGPVPDRGQHVVQRLPVAAGIEDLVGDHERRPQDLGELEQLLVAGTVPRAEVVVQVEEHAIPAEDLLVEREAAAGPAHQREAMPGGGGELLRLQPGGPLGVGHLRPADQPAEMGVALPVLREQDDPVAPAVEVDAIPGRGCAVVEGQLDADYGPDASRFRRADEPHCAVEAVAVGDRKRRDLQLAGARHQFLRVRRALEKTEIRVAVQFSVHDF